MILLNTYAVMAWKYREYQRPRTLDAKISSLHLAQKWVWSSTTQTSISIAHPLPTFSDVKDDKVIVKFIRRETRNEFYSKRKSVAGRKASTFDSFKEHDLAGAEKKVYIGESLTPFRKKLFGAVNKIKKKLEWKFIWTNNGRIYLKQSDSSRSYTFDSGSDLNNFETKMKLPVTDTSKFKSNNKAKLKNRNTSCSSIY